jgi:type IV pilus assembly protein PilQ
MGVALLFALLAAPPSEREALVAVDVREASVTDVVAALAEAAGAQVVFDPGIACRLTVRFTGVAYADALENVLRACGLGSETEGSVVRVAARARLTEERAERRRLAQAQRAAAPRQQTRLRLSYARAAQVAPLLKKLLSARAEVVFDERTNTLIIID